MNTISVPYASANNWLLEDSMNCMMIRRSVREWLREHVGDESIHWRYLGNQGHVVMWFQKPQHAMLFKLRWWN